MSSTEATNRLGLDVRLPKPQDDTLEDKTGWAAAILATVRSEFRAQGFDVGLLPKQTDAPMTLGSESIDTSSEVELGSGVKDLSAAASTRRDKSLERISISLDGGRLGEVKVTVGRENGAIQVEIGIEDLHQRALAGLEQGRLVAALRAAGLKVASVTVGSPEAAGTALAQGRRRIHGPLAEHTVSAYRGVRPRQDADSEEGVDLVG